MADSHATAVEAAVPNPELRHHFADMEQQKNAASLGMWLFLVTEIMFFGGMFCAYLIYRFRYFDAFAAGSQSLDVRLGAFNTAVLLVSSLTVVLAVRAAQDGKRHQLVAYLAITVVLGLTFLGVKAVEYAEKFEKHHVPGPTFQFTDTYNRNGEQVHLNADEVPHAQMFFAVYFAMTGMHALHMIIGCGLFTVLAVLAWKGRYSPGYFTPIENGGLYWHLVDIIWIYLFPLLYLIDRHH